MTSAGNEGGDDPKDTNDGGKGNDGGGKGPAEVCEHGEAGKPVRRT